MKRLIAKIERFFYWGWALRNSQDWDNYYLDEIMLLKLERMRKCFNSEEFHHNRWSMKLEGLSGSLIDQYKADVALDVCILILKRRMDCQYYDKLVGLEKLYENTEHKFDGLGITLLVDGKPATPEFKKKLTDARHLSAEIEVRDQKLLYHLMQKYTNGWWS
jgi:hypothetical protein